MAACLNRSYEYKALQQKGTSLSAGAGISDVSSHYLLIEQETVTTLWDILKNHALELVRGSVGVNTNANVNMLAAMPNQSFINAIDITTIEAYNMLMIPKRFSESSKVLDEEEEEFMALSMEIISDLIDEEPDICTTDDVKVRFR